MKKRRISIYDTTLRDGAQGEGVSFSGSGRLRFAERLDAFGIDYIEGGYPGSNPSDDEFFKQARQLRLQRAKLVAFGRTRRKKSRAESDPYLKALADSGARVATIYGKSWKLHVREVLGTTLDENLRMIRDSVRYLKKRGMEVMFDAEHFFDGYKDDPEYAMECVGAALDGGAVTAVLCDTNGGSLPSEVFESVSAASRRFGAILGIHTHDDSGMAAANAVEAVRAGAIQVQGTINGYGERCGNANLCTVIPALVMKAGVDCLCAASLPRLREMSEFVADLLNLRPDSKAPFVGGSAFSHKGGPHVDAVRKNPRTFEHVTPESVGNSRRMLMSDLAGSSGVLLKAVEVGAGALASKKDAREVLGALKEMERKGYAFEAADASFRILIQKVLREHRSFFDLEGFRVIIEKRGKDLPCVSEATIRVRVRGESEHTAAEGDGPVNALDRALRKALLRFYPEIAKVFLTDFRVRILDPQEATAAKTRVLIESSDGEERWGTVGVSGNIIEASWEALVDSVEYKLFREEEKARARDGKKLRPKGR